MTSTAAFQLGSILDRYMRQKGLSEVQVAKAIGLNRATIGRIRKGLTNPQSETRDLLELYLQENGAMTRLGFPTEVTPAIEPPPVDDTAVLRDMGIVTTKPKGHYVCASLDDRQFLRLLQAIQGSPIPVDEQEALIGLLCAADFSSLA